MKIKLLFLVAALTGALTLNVHATAPTPPAQAAAAGFTNLVFDDEFTTSTTIAPTTSASSGYNWYPYQGTVPGDYVVNTGAGTGATAGATGVLTINNSPNGWNQTLQTTPMSQLTAGTGTYKHAYFEARLQFTHKSTGSAGSGGWPSFWSFAIQGQTPATGKQSAECDFLEAWASGSGQTGDFINTMHNWANTSNSAAGTDLFNTDTTNQQTTPPPPTDDGWHTYGCLWVQTSATNGYVEFYFDNVLVVHQGGVTRYLTGAGQGLSAQEVDDMYVILGTAPGWPLNVDWVHVWQSGSTGTTAQTVSNFPSTLSLTTAASPYTLPATTTAGLTLNYSVVSGPATVSGNTLTLTGAGTVVVQATQGGNATYAAYSGTETITATAAAGTTTQTVSGFPSTLSLSTAASPYTLPTTTSAGLTISYSVTSGPATVSGHILTLTGAGTVVLKASQAGNATYAAYSATETITVTTTAQTVSNFPSTLSLTTAASPDTLPATTSAGLTLAYSVTSGPATVSGNTLMLTGAGTVVLHASQAGNAMYAPFSATETITVTAATGTTGTTQTVSNFPSSLSLTTSQSPYTLPATTSAGLTITYTIASGPGTVSGNTLTLTGPGTVGLLANQAGNATYAPFSGTEVISVTTTAGTPQPQTVSNFPATLSLTTATSPYTLPGTTSAGLTITYSVTSGPATVSGDLLTVTGAGTVVVQASQAGNASYTAFSGTETITVTASSAMAFSQWEAQSGYFTATELANAAISGPTADPEDDGVPNLLKYLYDINPTTPMTAADYAAMPVSDVDTTTTPGTTYLTLTYRQNALETGITINVQTSPDLQTWTTVTPNISRKISTDPTTGDPIMEVEVNTKASTREFIRLYVTAP